jgi:hypothetical protein
MPGVPGRGKTGLRAANTRLRELLAERDPRIEEQGRGDRAAPRGAGRAAVAGRGPGRAREDELPALLEAAVVGRAGQAVAEVAARQVRPEAGQAEGAARVTMELTEHPDKKVQHRPAKRGGCGKSLKNASVTAAERRQVIDIPPVKTVTTVR